MNRATWILIAVLAASLAWAYGSTQRKTPTAKDPQDTLWKIASDSIRKVQYKAGETHVMVTSTARKSGKGRYLWVEGEGMRATPPPQRKRGKKEPAPAAEPTNESFQGGAQAQRFLEEVATLPVVRVLGNAKDLKLEDYGLAGEAASFLLIEREGATPLRLALGNAAAGNATRYALSSVDNRVVLVRNAMFRNLTNVRRFMERELFPFPVQEAQRIEAQAGDRKVTLTKLDLPPTEPNRWARAAQDKAGDPALQEVVNGLVRIKALRYLGDAGDLEKAPALITVSVTKDGGAPATLRIVSENSKGEAIAISSHTERPVALNVGLVKTLQDRIRAAAKP